MRIDAIGCGDPGVRAVHFPEEENNGDTMPALLTLNRLKGEEGEHVGANA